MRIFKQHGRRLLIALAFCALNAHSPRAAVAQQPLHQPLLDELNRQTQVLYQQVAEGVVRVQLPMTRPSTQPVELSSGNPLSRWNAKLSPDMREQLSLPEGVGFFAELVPANGPTIASRSSNASSGGQPSESGPALQRQARLIVFAADVLGVVIDAQGHALLPLFVPAENVGGKPLVVLLASGAFTHAKFIGSDQKTNLTVIQLQPGVGRPLPFSTQPPVEGSLVMLMSMDPSATHMAVWTRWAHNSGLVVRIDGTVAGFSQRNGFLSGMACAPVVRQLIDQGHVDRPHLGVSIRVVDSSDPLRQANAALGQTPALLIGEVLAGSPAEKAGLRRGDLILSLAGQQVGDTASFAAAIATLHGATQIQILRQEQGLSVTVDLEPRTSN